MRPLYFCILCLLTLPRAAGAQTVIPVNAPNSEEILKQVSLDQKMNAAVPADVLLRDESGREVRLGQFWQNRPLMLVMIQLRCRQLCTQQMSVLLESLKELKFTPGKEFELVVVSIDPREDPAMASEVKASMIERYGRPEAASGWHYLTGASDQIARLAEAVGFNFVYDQNTDQYAHPDGVMIVTPAGRLSRYFFRLSYPARDLRLGLVEAADGKIGSPLDAFALMCYHYNPLTGKYSLSLMSTLRIAALGTILLLVSGISLLGWRYRMGRVSSPAGRAGTKA